MLTLVHTEAILCAPLCITPTSLIVVGMEMLRPISNSTHFNVATMLIPDKIVHIVFEDVERMKGAFKFVPRWRTSLSPFLLQCTLNLAVRHTLTCSKERCVHTKNLHWFELRGVRYSYSLNFHITSSRYGSSISTPRILLLRANHLFLIRAQNQLLHATRN